MRQYVIPEIFFKNIAEKGGLYSRIWFYWLSGFVDEIFDTDFLEKQEADLSKFPKINFSEIREIYHFGVQLLQQDFEIIENKKNKKKASKKELEIAKEVLDYLNEKTGSTFSSKGNNVELIIGRLNEGYLIEDFIKVIDQKTADWKGTDWQKFLRPLTLFQKSKFENYLNSKNDKSTPKTRFEKFADSFAKAQSITFRTNE